MRHAFTVYLDDQIPAEREVANYIYGSPLRRQDLLRNLLIRSVGIPTVSMPQQEASQEGQQPLVVEPYQSSPAPALVDPQELKSGKEKPRYGGMFDDK